MFTNELWNKPPAGATGFYSYQIANSCRFNSGSTSNLSRTLGTPSNSDIMTISAWIKRGTLGGALRWAGAGYSGGDYGMIGFTNSTADTFQVYDYPTSNLNYKTNALYRDTGGWTHFVVRLDTSQSTAGDRVRIYVNGTEVTNFTTSNNPSQNTDLVFNTSGRTFYVGSAGDTNNNAYQPYDGYIAEFIMADGQSYAPTQFGETKNGVWIPKDPSGTTFGNNGFHLKFENASDLGNDSSGNNNDFTPANLSAHDQMLDSPTFNSNSNGGNFMTYNGAWVGANNTLSEGNLKSTGSSGGNTSGTFGMLTGKWYWECRAETVNSYGPTFGIGQSGIGNTDGQYYVITWQTAAGQMYGGGGAPVGMGTITVTSTGVSSLSSGDILSFWLDCDNRKLWIGKNGTIPNSGDPANGTNPQASWATTPTDRYFTATCQNVGSGAGVLNAGQNPSFNGGLTGGDVGTATDKNGYGLFKYDPSGTDFIACCAANIPTADAIDPAQTDDNYPQKLVDAIIYTGTGSEKAVAVGWQPDLTWVKERGGANDNKLTDSVRGATKALESNTNAAETTDAQGVKAFTSTGFTLGTNAVYNNNTDTYVAWNWKEGADYGLDIVTYSGTLTGSGVVNISHSLGAIPECIWHMRRTGAGGAIRHKDLTDANYIISNNDTMSGSSGTGWGKSAQGSKSNNGNMTALGTSSTFTTNYTGLLNENGSTYVAYVWKGIEGFSKFGSYEGNGSGTDGPFIYTGFRPALVIIKNADANTSFFLQDNARDPFNPVYHVLKPQNANAEEAYTDGTDYNDFLSNGFKVARGGNAQNFNTSNNTYIYMAWAENPFKYATSR
jgi:hypothetical protein